MQFLHVTNSVKEHKREGWTGNNNLVFGQMGRIWAGVEDVLEIYQVRYVDCVRWGGTGSNSYRKYSKECMPTNTVERSGQYERR